MPLLIMRIGLHLNPYQQQFPHLVQQAEFITAVMVMPKD